MKLFVYGTLKKGFYNHRLLEKASFVGETTIKGNMYSLGGFPCVSLDGTNTCFGEVYEIDEPTLAMCDLLEGYRGEGLNNFYERSMIKTDHGEAYIYHIENDTYHNRLIESGVW